MADIRAAILGGVMEARRAHDRLGTRETWERAGGRIDVFGAIDAYDIPLMFQPLDNLLGAFLPEPSPGVIVTTKRPLSVRRYTAAHELGHYLMRHQPSLDDDGLLRRSPFAEHVDYDPQEVAADSFAVSFLLPLWLVGGHMTRHRWTPMAMQEPINVYQLAVRAGLSYLATCYALRRYKVIDAPTCSALVALKPKSIKQRIIPGYDRPNWHFDVWRLDQDDEGVFVEAAPGDVFEIDLLEHSGGGYVWNVGGLGESDLKVVLDRREKIGDAESVGGHVVRRITAEAHAPGLGSVRFVEERPWQRGAMPLASYQFSYDIKEFAEPGLFPAQRERMLGGRD